MENNDEPSWHVNAPDVGDDYDLIPIGAKVRRRDDWSQRGVVTENAQSRNVIIPKGKVAVFWTSGNQVQTKEFVKDLDVYG